MTAIFGESTFKALKNQLKNTSQQKVDVEKTIKSAIQKTLEEIGAKHVLFFRFRNPSRTTHFLIFATKHIRGYNIMKDVMARESSNHIQGVATFEYAPQTIQISTFDKLNCPMEKLKNSLLKDFSGSSKSVLDIFNSHNIGTNYILKNYKDALKQLMLDGKVTEKKQSSKKPLKPPFKTMADDRIILFPFS